MSIRRATVDDAEALTRLHTRAWQATYTGILPDALLAFPAEALDDRIAKRRAWIETMGPEQRHWLLESSQRIVCWAATGPCRSDDLGPSAHELYALYAATEEIGKGYGRTLMDHCVADLRARGFDELVLSVLEANERGRRFYAAAGFEPDTRVAPTEFRDTGAMHLRLRLDL